GFYSEVLVAIQLAHRTATLSDVDLARFLSAVEQMAVRLDADFDVPDVSALAEQAKQLGQTCARFDVQLGLTLESMVGPWDGARLSQVMMAHGLVRAQGQPVRWLCLDAHGRICFSLAPASLLVDRLALEMDVPLVAMAEHPLKRMFDIAQQLATSLQARVVDDHGQIIGEHSFAAIDNQLQLLLEQMRAAGIEPGSARTLRLYGALGE
ncbi:MAG TPA: cell division protein ZipA C-terminal FtsZ-binding domain-containing protein, partial [Burkholderiaceae bacterium]|nr:cell division protein ZipA C-terminal FtsZ-binding domain-containing protein [Burkholderiaceae bacterium]